MIKTLLSAVLLSATLLCIGCKDKDDDPVTCSNWAIDIQAEADLAASTGIAWANDSTNTAKCNDYKAALQAYANALQGAESCAIQVGQQADWQAAIDSINASANSLPC